MSWDYVLDKPSAISCMEPDFILLSLHIPGDRTRLQGWQDNRLETKRNRGTWHVSSASSAAKTINRPALCYDRRSLKWHLTGPCTSGGVDGSPPHCHHAAGNWDQCFIDWTLAGLWFLCCAFLQDLSPLALWVFSQWKTSHAPRESELKRKKGLEVVPPLISPSPPAGGRATKRGMGQGKRKKRKEKKAKKKNPKTMASLLSGFSLLTFEDFCLWGESDCVLGPVLRWQSPERWVQWEERGGRIT